MTKLGELKAASDDAWAAFRVADAFSAVDAFSAAAAYAIFAAAYEAYDAELKKTKEQTMTMDRDMDHYREDEIATKLAWSELTDEAKGSLLLFHNRGGTIQRWWEGTQSWEDTQHPDLLEEHYYRVKPEQDGKRRFASILGLSTAPAWAAYDAYAAADEGE